MFNFWKKSIINQFIDKMFYIDFYLIAGCVVAVSSDLTVWFFSYKDTYNNKKLSSLYSNRWRFNEPDNAGNDVDT